MNRRFDPRRGLALALLLPLVACKSTAPEPEPAQLTPLNELPAEYADLWRAWKTRSPEYPDLRDAALADPARTRFLVENLIDDLLTELTAGNVDTGREDQSPRYRLVGAELVHLGPHSAPALAEVMTFGLGLGPVAVEGLLLQIGTPAVAPLVGLLERKEPVARRRGAKALGEIQPDFADPRLDHPAVRAALGARLQSDDDWIVRSQCALAMARWGRHDPETAADAARYLVPALADADLDVRKDVVHGLARLGDPRTFPALFNYLERSERDGDPSAVLLTQAALTAMTRNKQAHTVAEWRAWWSRERPGILQRFLGTAPAPR
ncbi:MAG: HEAT repeat domain-containing protein [Planctomycetota bacterium]